MHYLTVLKDWHYGFRPEGPKTNTLKAGEYVTEDVLAGQMIYLMNGGRMQPVTEKRAFDEMKDWNGKRILFMRAGGFGDLILLTPILREVARRWPKAIIAVSATERYSQVLQNLPFVHQILPNPIPRESFDSFDAWVMFEKAIEDNALAKKIHMTDLFASITGLTGIKDKKPALELTNRERIWVMEGYPRKLGVRRIAIQVGASAICRVYPHDRLSEVATELNKKGWEIFLLGDKNDECKVEERGGLRNLVPHGLTFRQSAAVVNNCDCVLASDSALIHVAAALGVPAVGLYGPFPSKLRTAYSPTVTALQGKGQCAPCFHHKHLWDHWPENGPCRIAGRCVVLDSIRPEDIVRKIEKIARKFELTEINGDVGPVTPVESRHS
jgi:ADP-heptose:LPS heptosyltransferase